MCLLLFRTQSINCCWKIKISRRSIAAMRVSFFLLSVAFVLVLAKKKVDDEEDSDACVDGVHNIIRVEDISKGKGKVVFSDVEVATYDEKKNPSCKNGKGEFRLPGHFKLYKGFVEVKEAVSEPPTLELALTVEKNSFLIGKVCENGKSQNSFVPDALCKMNLCAITSSLCDLIKRQTNGKLDMTVFTQKDPIDIGALPIPQLGGDWKLRASVLQDNKLIASAGVGKGGKEFFTIFSDESASGGEIKYSPLPGSNPTHSEL